MTEMFNPPHPGGLIAESVEYYGLSINAAARRLGVAPSTLHRVMQGKTALTSDMAVRLEAAGLGGARILLAMQTDYDLWQSRQSVDVSAIAPPVKLPTEPPSDYQEHAQ